MSVIIIIVIAFDNFCHVAAIKFLHRGKNAGNRGLEFEVHSATAMILLVVSSFEPAPAPPPPPPAAAVQ